MRMKPAQRNAIQATAKAAAQEVSQLERSLAKLEKGTLPYNRLKKRLDEAKSKQVDAASRLARTTQPN